MSEGKIPDSKKTGAGNKRDFVYAEKAQTSILLDLNNGQTVIPDDLPLSGRTWLGEMRVYF